MKSISQLEKCVKLDNRNSDRFTGASDMELILAGINPLGFHHWNSLKAGGK